MENEKLDPSVVSTPIVLYQQSNQKNNLIREKTLTSIKSDLKLDFKFFFRAKCTRIKSNENCTFFIVGHRV